MVRIYKKNPNVEYAEPDFLAEVLATVPDDPYFSSQWGLSAIQAEEAWDIETGASNPVIISIVDTGVNYNHPDLAGKVLGGYDFVNNDNDPMDDHSHGTHCAGIASAVTNNSLGIAGVSWHAFIMPFKVLDYRGWGSYSDVASGITTAASWGADVISLSLGGTSNSATLENAVNYAYDQGCFIVAATGNSGDETLLYPAACNKAMGVAATDQYDQRAYFSSYGSHVDISAPGVTILSTVRGTSYANKNGTSMATPHVTGLAALIWSKKPELTNDQVGEVITQTADDIYPDGFDMYTGYGRINALTAMQLLQPTQPPAPPEPGEPPYLVVEKFGDPTEIWQAGSNLTPDRTGLTITLEGVGDPVTISGQPVDVVLIIDRSGSMRDQKIADAKIAAKVFIDQMRAEDRAALVSFASRSYLRAGLTIMDAEGKQALKAAIGSLFAYGGTHIPSALATANGELIANGDPSRNWVEILLTDGLTSYSHLIDEQTDPLIVETIDAGISVYTIGLGYWIQIDLLRNIASWTGARYYHAPRSEDLLDIYEEIAQQVLNSLAGENITVTEVLQDYINSEGDFSIAPDQVFEDSQGTTALIWNIESLLIGEKWSVSFDLSSSLVGENIPVDVQGDSQVNYADYERNPAALALPETLLTVRALGAVEAADIFITPRSFNVGRRGKRFFMIHVFLQQPMDMAGGNEAEVLVDVDDDGIFEEDEEFDAIVTSAGEYGMDIAIKVYLGNSLKNNQPGVAIYSINGIGIVYPDGNVIDDLWLNTFIPRRKRSRGK